MRQELIEQAVEVMRRGDAWGAPHLTWQEEAYALGVLDDEMDEAREASDADSWLDEAQATIRDALRCRSTLSE